MTDQLAWPYPYEHLAPIFTDRLTLRLFEPGDVDAVHGYQSREDVARYELYEPRERDVVAEKVAQYAKSTRIAREGDFLQLAVVRTEDDVLVGDLYFKLKSVVNHTGEIGWTLHPDHQGHGYATEAARAMLGVAFGLLRLHRVIAELDPRNEASIRLCRRLGMREEAHFVKDLWFKGAWGDTGIYAILAEEFEGGVRVNG